MKHASKSKVSRYPSDTPHWKVMYDYYMAVAKDAERLGKAKKAKRFKKKAGKEFLKAGGLNIEL